MAIRHFRLQHEGGDIPGVYHGEYKSMNPHQYVVTAAQEAH